MAGPKGSPEAKPGLHPRNRHRLGYDFPALVAACAELGPFVRRAPHGGPSIDFADAAAVKTLNRALLAEAYGIQGWDLPAGALCPPIPGRADYVHHLADLLAAGGPIPRGAGVRVLEVGVGASAIYPLIGIREYGWTFVGTEIDATALASAARIRAANPGLAESLELRHQPNSAGIFAGVLRPGEWFAASLCNPPFHGSLRAAQVAAQQKWRKLGRGQGAASRNFGGQGAELWCEGGEVGFLLRMIAESADSQHQVGWFTTLVSKSATLPLLQRALRQAGASDLRVVAMAQGQKQSRFLAWTFLAGQGGKEEGQANTRASGKAFLATAVHRGTPMKP